MRRVAKLAESDEPRNGLSDELVDEAPLAQLEAGVPFRFGNLLLEVLAVEGDLVKGNAPLRVKRLAFRRESRVGPPTPSDVPTAAGTRSASAAPRD